MVNYKELYNIVVKEFCEKPITGQEIYINKKLDFINNGHAELIENDGIFNYRLIEDKATYNDYQEFCEYILEMVGIPLEIFEETGNKTIYSKN